MLSNSYQHMPNFPWTPGLEWSGTIINLGEEAHRAGWRVGMNVTGNGSGLSSVIFRDYRELMRMPEAFSYAEAAGFWVGMSTAYHVLVERANLKKNERVLVNGATGGMGMAACLLAKKIGAHVYATGGSDLKLARVAEFAGIPREHCINYTENSNFSSFIKERTNAQGVDVVFDPVGGSAGLEGLKSTAWGARYCIVGFTSGTRQLLKSNYVLIKGLSVLGCRAGEFVRQSEDSDSLQQHRRERLLAWAKEDGLTPLIDREYAFTTEGVQACFLDILERKVVGRAVVTMPALEQSSSCL